MTLSRSLHFPKMNRKVEFQFLIFLDSPDMFILSGDVSLNYPELLCWGHWSRVGLPCGSCKVCNAYGTSSCDFQCQQRRRGSALGLVLHRRSVYSWDIVVSKASQLWTDANRIEMIDSVLYPTSGRGTHFSRCTSGGKQVDLWQARWLPDWFPDGSRLSFSNFSIGCAASDLTRVPCKGQWNCAGSSQRWRQGAEHISNQFKFSNHITASKSFSTSLAKTAIAKTCLNFPCNCNSGNFGHYKIYSSSESVYVYTLHCHLRLKHSMFSNKTCCAKVNQIHVDHSVISYSIHWFVQFVLGLRVIFCYVDYVWLCNYIVFCCFLLSSIERPAGKHEWACEAWPGGSLWSLVDFSAGRFDSVWSSDLILSHLFVDLDLCHFLIFLGRKPPASTRTSPRWFSIPRRLVAVKLLQRVQ